MFCTKDQIKFYSLDITQELYILLETFNFKDIISITSKKEAKNIIIICFNGKQANEMFAMDLITTDDSKSFIKRVRK